MSAQQPQMSPSIAEQKGRERPGSRGLRLVLGGIVVLSTVLGVMAYRRYRSSEDYIQASLEPFRQAGRRLDPEGCIDRVLSWHKDCAAMAGLCQAAVARLMGLCLRAQDRGAYCRSLGRSTTDTRFGYQECKRRGVKRHRKKACAGLYRTIDAHCHALGVLTLPQRSGGKAPSPPRGAVPKKTDDAPQRPTY